MIEYRHADSSVDSPGLVPAVAQPLDHKTLYGGFRDLGVIAVLDAEPPLACDPSFNRYSAFWLLGPTVDATYPALEGLRLVPRGEDAPEDPPKSALVRFLAAHFEAERGRFSTNGSPRTRGIFGFLSAINLIKSWIVDPANEGPPNRRPLGERRFREEMDAVSGPTEAGIALQGLEDLIRECRPDDGEGLLDNPDKPLLPSLTTLSTACSVLWNVWPEAPRGKLERFFPPRALERFIGACVQRTEEFGTAISGFSIHPDVPQPCVNTTFFGLRLAERLGVDLDPDDRAGMEAFLVLSYKDGGFSSTRNEPRSLNATHFGLRALRMLGSKHYRKIQEQRHQVCRFVDSCRRPATGGYAFSDDFKRYKENTLASRYAMYILSEVGVEPPPETRRFFTDRFDAETGGFHAYPESAVATEGLDVTKIERYLQNKDRQLFESFDRQVTANASGREWRRIEELYDRLAALDTPEEAANSTATGAEAEAAWKELRSLQARRAREVRAYFEQTTLGPLDEALAVLNELEQPADG
jgi:hypothetical protein